MRIPIIFLFVVVSLMSYSKGVAQGMETFKEANAADIQAEFEVMSGLQLIYKNSIKWLTEDGELQDKKPDIKYGLCGTVPHASRNIQNKKGSFYEASIKGHYGYIDEVENEEIYSIWSRTDVNYLGYLNGATKHSYTGNSGAFAVYHLPYDYYIFETAKTKGIVQIVNATAKEESANTTSKFQQEVLLEGDFQEIETFGYNHPLRFKKDGLYGYFPMNQTAKYKSLEQYNQHFAAFEYPDGRKGWIDLEGKEYFVAK